ncbi:head-to-tail stopper [Microbacterium phage OscarSo]|uniref:Head-to-tail stopper n=1 Tax=Microbacterium phage OscarSo TaxID=2985324 RepID=A0A9X9K511_9CAUD|nr:head-to-tail stopper [Microbacterium phage OscarSo]UYL87140.1 head-to-tail stopper [Microbacterium phage OscarSo]
MIATTRAALLRGTSKDALGDEIPSGSPVAGFDDFPIAITDTSGNEYDESSNAWRFVRKYTGRVSSRVPVKAGDQIRDRVTGELYAVGEIYPTRRSISGRSTVTMSLKRTAPTP